MKTINWPLTLLFVCLFLFLLAAFANHLEPRFCSAAMLEAISRQQDVLLFNCFEFWLNRYQGGLGSLATAAVAGMTLWWIARQLKAANRQASVAAAQSLRVRIDELDKEDAGIQRLIVFSDKEKGNSDRHYMLGLDITEADDIHKYYDEAISETWRNSFMVRKYMEMDPLGERTHQYLDLLEALHDIAEVMRDIRNFVSPNMRHDWTKRSAFNSDGDDHFIELSKSAVKLERAAMSASASVDAARLDTWLQIRQFEAAAITGS